MITLIITGQSLSLVSMSSLNRSNKNPKTPPKKTQQIPKKSQTTNRPDKLPDILHKLIHLLLQIWLKISHIVSNRDENELKVDDQKTNKQDNTDKSPKGVNPKEECTICNGPHSNLMSCPKMTQYLPFGRYHPTPMWLCPQCLSTKHWNAGHCNHMGNKGYNTTLCPITRKHYLLCSRCENHFPGIKYMNYHHDPSLGFKNFSLMRQCLGSEMFKSLTPYSAYSTYKGYC